MVKKELNIGSKVVYAKPKSSVSPGPRAKDVHPHSKGDGYHYVVEKHWTVKALHDDGMLTLVTRRGKEHRVSKDDPHLRLANWWQRWRYGERFPELGEGTHDLVAGTETQHSEDE